LIPVNDGFDGALGPTVDPKSVHGQFIQRSYNSSKREFEATCDALLPKGQGVPSGRKGRKTSYPIGTTVAVTLDGRQSFIFALSRTDPETLKARADIPAMWQALNGLWSCVRDHSNGHAVSLPLVGAGQSGVGIEPTQLLRLILLSILVETREREVCKRITIVLHPDMFNKVDLRSIRSDWS
jgi:antiphage defense system Thoeris ThsA-like protein